MIERKIIVGMITSTEYLQQIQEIWNIKYLKSASARRLATWCMEYFDNYHKAPNKTIEDIYSKKLRDGLPEELGIDIEDTLRDLNTDYATGIINTDYLLDNTREYFKERGIEMFLEDVKEKLDEKEIMEAEIAVMSYLPVKTHSETDLDLKDPIVIGRVQKAFKEAEKPLLCFKGPFGEFMNHHTIRSGFIAFMATEKRGKSFVLLEFAIEGAREANLNVAFFQAGDMGEGAQLKRIAARLLKRPTLKKHQGMQYQAVKDCFLNQTDNCTKTARIKICNTGIFSDGELLDGRINPIEQLIEYYKDIPEYKPCTACRKVDEEYLGTVWIEKINVGKVITGDEAAKVFKKKIIKKDLNFRLSTHPNTTLSVKKIETILSLWESQDNFVPDIIVIDYADLLVTDTKIEFRHQQNEIWKALRGLSQKKHCLVITATQADAKAYDQNSLKSVFFYLREK